jgi:predicted nucleotidyltransferase
LALVLKPSKVYSSQRKNTGSKKIELSEKLPFANIIPKLVSIILNSTDKSVIQKIYLFGSYAYGKPDSQSDLDICIIIDDNKPRNFTYINVAKNLCHKYNISNYDLLVYRENEFYHGQNSESIENTIMENGILLYER